MKTKLLKKLRYKAAKSFYIYVDDSDLNFASIYIVYDEFFIIKPRIISKDTLPEMLKEYKILMYELIQKYILFKTKQLEFLKKFNKK